MDVPYVDTENPLENATQTIKSAIPWLPDPKVCEQCGSRCKASWTYDRRTAAFHAETGGKVASWVCTECEQAYRREEPSMAFSVWK